MAGHYKPLKSHIMKKNNILEQTQNIGFVVTLFFLFFVFISIFGGSSSEFGNFVRNNMWTVIIAVVILLWIIFTPTKKEKAKDPPKV